MPQPKHRNQRVHLEGIGRAPDHRGGRMDPIFNEILPGSLEDHPGAIAAMLLIEDMRAWGVDVTVEIAQKCMVTSLWRASQDIRYRNQLDANALARRHPSIVYYMRLGNLVKIGFTENLTGRLDTINPEELMVTEPGGRERERARHDQFADLRVHGEWFRLEPPLAEHIEAVRREAAGD